MMKYSVCRITINLCNNGTFSHLFKMPELSWYVESWIFDTVEVKNKKRAWVIRTCAYIVSACAKKERGCKKACHQNKCLSHNFTGLVKCCLDKQTSSPRLATFELILCINIIISSTARAWFFVRDVGMICSY